MGFAGHDAVPGVSTSIGFEIKQHIRLPKPLNDCRHGQSLKEMSEYEYSYIECRSLCSQKLVIKKCGCQQQGHFTSKSYSDVPHCGKYDL